MMQGDGRQRGVYRSGGSIKTPSSQIGRRAFWALREEAKKNGLTGMTLEEINEEIRAARRGE